MLIASTKLLIWWETPNAFYNLTLIGTIYIKKNGVNFHSFCHWPHSLESDLSDHLLEWISSKPDEIPLSSEFSSILELESSEIHSSTSEFSSLHGWSELFVRFLESTSITFHKNLENLLRYTLRKKGFFGCPTGGTFKGSLNGSK